ncbi:hypothetical protein ACFQ4O_14890, partial [Methylopila musalis]
MVGFRKTGGVVRGLLLAYLLVIQSALGGLALGSQPLAAAPAAAIDCLSGHGSDSGPAQDHGAVPGCCVTACAFHAGGMAA